MKSLWIFLKISAVYVLALCGSKYFAWWFLISYYVPFPRVENEDASVIAGMYLVRLGVHRAWFRNAIDENEKFIASLLEISEKACRVNECATKSTPEYAIMTCEPPISHSCEACTEIRDMLKALRTLQESIISEI